MLTARGNAKVLTRSFQERRDSGVIDSTTLSDDEKEYLEISGSTGQNPPDMYKTDTHPIDPFIQVKYNSVDLRDLPQMGGK